MTAEIWFYHLERSGLEAVLPPLLEKTVDRGWRALVRTTNAERVAALDDQLWVLPRRILPAPRARRSSRTAELQPILLTDRAGAANSPNVLFLIDGAEADDIEGLDRVILLFDGHDEAAVKTARERWSVSRSAATR